MNTTQKDLLFLLCCAVNRLDPKPERVRVMDLKSFTAFQSSILSVRLSVSFWSVPASAMRNSTTLIKSPSARTYTMTLNARLSLRNLKNRIFGICR